MPDSSIPPTFQPLIDQAIVVTGATASGKSALALELAEKIGGEILSLDSIAVYREMDIGTAKPSSEDRMRVPHHLIDIAEPDEDFSVARYLDIAHSCVGEIIGRGKRPIFVGGTPMFLKAILRGFDPGPPADWEFRKAVEQDLETYGVEALRQRLAQVDQLSAQRIDPGDTRRMIRALEVAKHTGMPLSHRQVQFDRARHAECCNVFALKWPRSVLHDRINQRVQAMFDNGLVDEVRGLVARYTALSRTASQAVGYREIIEWLDSEERIESVQESVSAHTRQLARRQETWFRSFTEITTIEMDAQTETQSLVKQIAQRVQR